MRTSLTILLMTTLAASAASAAPRPVEVVAAVLVAEAGGQGEAAMKAVREVIQMRAYEQQRTELAVTTARFQFSCLNRTTPERLVAKARQHPRWPEAVRLAAAPVKQATVWHATHYHALTVRPRWAAGQRPVAIVGGHAFYKLTQ